MDMARSLWDVFVSMLSRHENPETEDDDQFVPSPMDLSVRVAHGGPDDEIERELHRINLVAEELEDTREDS